MRLDYGFLGLIGVIVIVALVALGLDTTNRVGVEEASSTVKLTIPGGVMEVALTLVMATSLLLGM